MSELINSILSWCAQHPEAIVTLVLGLPALAAWFKSSRAASVLKYSHMAFLAVEELARLDPNKYTTSAAKVADYLDKIDALLQAAGSAPLSDVEKAGAAVASHAINAAQAPAAGPQQASPQP